MECGGQQVELSEEPALWKGEAGSVGLGRTQVWGLRSPQPANGQWRRGQGRCGRSGQEASGPCGVALPVALEDSLNMFVVGGWQHRTYIEFADGYVKHGGIDVLEVFYNTHFSLFPCILTGFQRHLY